MKISVTGHALLTIVSGTVPTGRYAPDGSQNAVVAPGNRPVGLYHPCGALYVTVVTDRSKGHHAADGSTHAFFNGVSNELLHP